MDRDLGGLAPQLYRIDPEPGGKWRSTGGQQERAPEEWQNVRFQTSQTLGLSCRLAAYGRSK